jgi:hypothetical protein
MPTIVNKTATSVGSPFTIPATTVGNLLVVCLANGSSGLYTNVVDNASGGSSVFVQAPGAQAVSGTGRADIWYCLSCKGGATQISTSGTTSGNIVVYEISAGGDSFRFDVANAVSSQSASATPLGAPVTTLANDAIISIIFDSGAVSGMNGGNEFTNDFTTSGNGYAHITSTSPTAGVHQAQWYSTNSTFCSSTAAFSSGDVVKTTMAFKGLVQ